MKHFDPPIIDYTRQHMISQIMHMTGASRITRERLEAMSFTQLQEAWRKMMDSCVPHVETN